MTRATSTITVDSVRDPMKLYRYLLELERCVNKTYAQSRTTSVPADVEVDYAVVREELSAGGGYPLNVEGLLGVLADAQNAGLLVVTSEPPASNYPPGTLMLLNSGTPTLKYCQAGTPNTWVSFLPAASAPANMMTTDTNQTPGATVVKTWTARQVFNGGLDAAAAINITSGGLNVDAGGATISGDMNIEDELLISGTVVIDNTLSPYTVAANVSIVAVNTSGGAVTVNLPASVKLYRCILIKDVTGNAGANNITISGNGNNIDGAGSITLNVNYQSRFIQGTGSDWNILLGWL